MFLTRHGRPWIKSYNMNPLRLATTSKRLWWVWVPQTTFVHVCILPSWVSDHYLDNQSLNSLQTWCVHLLGECSELISVGATLVQYWPSSGQKMSENCCFWPLSGKLFAQSNSNFVCTLYTYLVSLEKWFHLVPCWPDFCPLVALKWLKMVVSDHYLKNYSLNPVQTWCVHLFKVSIQNWFDLGPRWPNLGL